MYTQRIILIFFALIITSVAHSKNDTNSEDVININKKQSNISFLENNGRIKSPNGKSLDNIDFSVTQNDASLFISNGKIQYQWSKPLTKNKKRDINTPFTQEERRQAFDNHMRNTPIAMSRVDVTLIGANKNAQLIKEEKQDYFETYYLSDKQDELKVSSFNKVTYKNIYPNIDWILYSKNNQLKYDFVIHPGGNPKDIKIAYKGAKSLNLKNGALHVTAPTGTITEQAPYSYNQETKVEIPSSFVLENDILSFDIEQQEGTMVIDPFLDWATYHGGNHYDWGSSVTTDYLGNIYMAGWTYSSNNIATSGAYMDTLHPRATGTGGWYYNGYVAKFNNKGVKQWGTYYPGFFNAAVCDGYGNLYLTGWTDSIPTIATFGAHQTTFGGRSTQYNWHNGDAFIVKFNTNGTRIWGTFYGGEERDGGNAITFDPAGYIYVGGTTASKQRIATSGSHLDTLPPYRTNYYAYYTHGWLAKFNTNGVRLWGTYYNGNITSISVDNSGNFAIVGTTFDTSNVATAGAHQTLHAGSVNPNNINNADGFIAKFNSSGVRQWGTYYGGTTWDWISGVDHDEFDNLYLTGSTLSPIWLASAGAHKTNITGSTYDAHLAKFSPTGTRVWATYFGGTNVEYGSSVKVSPLGKIYINGNTYSSSGIATTNAYKDTLTGNTYDSYIAEFTQAGVQTWGTYYGGSGVEYGWGWGWGGGWGSSGSHSIDASVAGKLYMVSATSSSDGIATPGAHQTIKNSGTSNFYDGFLVSFVVDTLPFVKHPFTDTLHCAGDTIDIKYGVTFPFRSGNKFQVQLSDANGGFGGTTIIGELTDTTDSVIRCVIPTTTATGSGYRVRILASNPSRISADNQIDMKIFAPPAQLTASSNSAVCVGDTIKLNVTHNTASGVTYSWAGPNSFSSSTQNPIKTIASLADTGDYIITATTGGMCSSIDTTNVVVNIIPAVPNASSNSTVCPNTTLALFASSSTLGVTYSWRGPNSFTSSNQNPAISNATYGMAGTYYVKTTRFGCTSAEDSAIVTVGITTPTPSASSNSPLCGGQTLDLTSTPITNATYKWTGPNNFSASSTNTTSQLPNINNNGAGTYYLTATVNGCESLKDSTVVVVNKAPDIAIYPSPGDSICVGGSVTFISLSNDAGTNPQYQWRKNGVAIPGATNKTYNTSNVKSGDIFHCILTSTTTCSSPAYDTSIDITMVVRPIDTPTVAITVDPGTSVKEGEMVSFTTTTTYAGKKPKFQWKINGKDVQGATGNVWGTTSLSDGDVISVTLTSDDPCAQPKTAASNEIKMAVALSVGAINELTAIKLYPNPNNGSFQLKGNTMLRGNYTIDIMNSIGQLVHHTTQEVSQGQIDTKVNLGNKLPSGTYMLRISAGDVQKVIRFNVNR